jgi:hypothetical protein
VYTFMLIQGLYGDPTLGARATDPTVPARAERRRRRGRPHLRRLRTAPQRGVRSALSFAFSSGGIDSEQT